MAVLVIAQPDRAHEVASSPLQKLAPDIVPSLAAASTALANYAAVVDLHLDERPQWLADYLALTATPVVVSAVSRPLHEMVAAAGQPVRCQLFGWNALPTMLERPVWEVSSWRVEERPGLQKLLAPAGVELAWVQDRIGMVTPRVLAMLINEAYWMLQEGAAEADAIDRALQLGTNYPHGPIAWGRKIGTSNLVRVLKALQHEFGTERCRIAARLIEEANTTQLGLGT